MTTTTPPRHLPLGERIVWARRRKGISQEKLAGLIGTSRRHMIRIEKAGKPGGSRPGPAFLKRIAEATDQPLELFHDEADEEEALDVPEDLLQALAPLARLLHAARRHESAVLGVLDAKGA